MYPNSFVCLRIRTINFTDTIFNMKHSIVDLNNIHQVIQRIFTSTRAWTDRIHKYFSTLLKNADFDEKMEISFMHYTKIVLLKILHLQLQWQVLGKAWNDSNLISSCLSSFSFFQLFAVPASFRRKNSQKEFFSDQS